MDIMFLLQGGGFTFLVGENLLWMTLYLLTAYLNFTASRYRAVSLLVAGLNAGRVSRTIVDPYGSLGTAMLATLASLLLLVLALGITSFASVVPFSRATA